MSGASEIDNGFDEAYEAIDNAGDRGLSSTNDVESIASPRETHMERMSDPSESSERMDSRDTSIESVGNEMNAANQNEENPPTAPPLPIAEPSLPGDYLPVASPVETPAERVERFLRAERQEENQNIPRATPQNIEEENEHVNARCFGLHLPFACPC